MTCNNSDTHRMALQKHSTAFEVADKQKNPALRYDIVIVHPFSSRNRRTRVFRDAFEGLRDHLSSSLPKTSSIHLFSFNGKSIINGKTSIETASEKLLKRLVEQRATLRGGSHHDVQFPSDEPDVEESRDTSSSREARNNADGHNDIAQPYLFFICHSLGSWIVKTVLSQNKHPCVSVFTTQGAILLDGPPVQSSTESYTMYIQSLHRAFFNRQATRPSDISSASKCLSSTLLNIDRKYSLWVDSASVKQERRKDQIAEEISIYPYRVWMTKDTIEVNQAPQPKTLRALVQKISRIMNAAPRKSINDRNDVVLALENLKLEDHMNQYVRRTNVPNKTLAVPMVDSVSSSYNVNDNEPSHSSLTARPLSLSTLSPEWYEKRRSARSSDMTIRTESDRASVGSVPNIPTARMGYGADEFNVRREIDMGISFVKRGELDNGEIAFSRASSILQKFKTRESSGYTVEIRAQLAGIALYRGKYEEAHTEFRQLLSICEKQMPKDYCAVMHRWVGIALLYQEEYELAVQEFQLLLDRYAMHCLDEEAQVRRDLALASAYSGNFYKAFEELKKAHELLDCLENTRSSVRNSVIEDKTVRRDMQSTELTIASNTLSGIEQGVMLPRHPRRLPRNTELAAKRDMLLLTRAKIGLLWGSFDSALKDSDHALRGMKVRWGPRHIKTLECAGLNSLLLALNSQTRAAENACTTTVREMSVGLGPEHPFTLEAMGHLVRIYQIQSRLLEAVETARSLAQIVKLDRRERHPQTLRYRCLHAESELKIGNFALSELELYDIVRISDERKDNRPETLNYQSLLALAYHHRAENDKAEELALRVLRSQLKMYVRRDDEHQGAYDQGKVDEDRVSRQIATLDEIASLDSLESVLKRLIGSDAFLIIRPPMLQTIWIICMALQQKEDSDSLKLATEILQAIRDRFVSKGQPDQQLDALKYRFSLALAIRREAEVNARVDSNDRLEDAAKHLYSVYRSRFHILGSKHPETLSAKLELIITNCTLGRWQELNELRPVADSNQLSKAHIEEAEHLRLSALDNRTWALVESESVKISYLHEGQLGGNHPETLKSLMWLFAVQMLLRDNASAFVTLEKVLIRLEKVREQRLVDSLDQEYKLALVVAEVNKQRAGEILRQTEKTVRDNRSLLPKRGLILENMVREEIRQIESVSWKEQISPR